MSIVSRHLDDDTQNQGRFTSSLALPSDPADSSNSVWLQQDETRQARCTFLLLRSLPFLSVPVPAVMPNNYQPLARLLSGMCGTVI